MSSSKKKWSTSTLSQISGKDKRYSPISERTMKRHARKFAIGRGPAAMEDEDGRPLSSREADALRFRRSPSSRSPTNEQEEQWASEREGLEEESSYDELETGRPIRLNCPGYMDVPDRVPLPLADEALLQRYFSPAAHRDWKRGVTRISGPDLMAQLTDSTAGFEFKSRLADAQMLATASRRAGDGPGECLSFFRLALLADNLREYGNALHAYKKYHSACDRLGDIPGVALALNCMGVNLLLMAETENDAAKKEKILKKAASYHQKHFEVGDTRSQYVANVNLGLVRLAQNDLDAALQAFQDSMKYALILKGPREQAVAFGNLAIASFERRPKRGPAAAERRDGGEGKKQQQSGDPDALGQARQFAEQQLGMLEEMPGAEEEAARACLLLGRVAAEEEDFDAAKEHCEQAMTLANDAGARGLAKVAKCFVGANLARSMLKEVIQETAKQMR